MLDTVLLVISLICLVLAAFQAFLGANLGKVIFGWLGMAFFVLTFLV